MKHQWTISIEVMPVNESGQGVVGDEVEHVFDVEASNAPDALVEAINLVRERMRPEDGFHMIHVGRRAKIKAKSRT